MSNSFFDFETFARKGSPKNSKKEREPSNRKVEDELDDEYPQKQNDEIQNDEIQNDETPKWENVQNPQSQNGAWQSQPQNRFYGQNPQPQNGARQSQSQNRFYGQNPQSQNGAWQSQPQNGFYGQNPQPQNGARQSQSQNGFYGQYQQNPQMQNYMEQEVVQQAPHINNSQPQNDVRQAWGKQSKKELLVEIVLDGTYSFTEVFPKVFYIMKIMLNVFERASTEYSVDIKYGLTVFHDFTEDKEYVDVSRFGVERSFFTSSSKEMIECLKEIEFYGGSETGKENLAKALNTGLRIVNNAGSNSSSRGLILFSDSIPEEQDCRPDFSEEYIGEEYINKGLRFANFYIKSRAFCPSLRMVNGEGGLGNDKNVTATILTLESILKMDKGQLENYFAEKVKDILAQVSVQAHS